MKVEFLNKRGAFKKCGLIAMPVTSADICEYVTDILELDKKMVGFIKTIAEQERFKAKPGQVLTFHTMGHSSAERIALIGIGEADSLTLEKYRRAGGKIAGLLKKFETGDAVVILKEFAGAGFTGEQMISAIYEGIGLGIYNFRKYKKSNGDELSDYAEPDKISFYRESFSGKPAAVTQTVKDAIAREDVMLKAVSFARDLVNEIPQELYPETLAERAKEWCSSISGLKFSVMNEKQMLKEGMTAALAVCQGSVHPPRFIEIAWDGPGASKDKLLYLVGKGVTFDSGGLNLKPGEHMSTMKMDMSGSAAVIAAIGAIAGLKLPLRVRAVVAAVENMPSGSSYKPDDVVTAMNGTTIEIGNTDAEGRVTLADSLSWAVKKEATAIVDLATLTGACVIALGPSTAGAFGNKSEWLESVTGAADQAGEKVHVLPLDPDMEEDIKSDIADVKNVGATRWGGSITAALFLKKFVGDTPWVHLDIAGPAFTNKPRDYTPTGGTGFGVRLLIRLAEMEAGV